MEYVWWPGMEQQLENRVKLCEQCQLSRHMSPKIPLHPWEWLERPWSRIHVDYVGPYLGNLFLLAVDAHSKWIEVVIVPSATSTTTIEKLRAILPPMSCLKQSYRTTELCLRVPNSRNLPREIISSIFELLRSIRPQMVKWKGWYKLSKTL